MDSDSDPHLHAGPVIHVPVRLVGPDEPQDHWDGDQAEVVEDVLVGVDLLVLGVIAVALPPPVQLLLDPLVHHLVGRRSLPTERRGLEGIHLLLKLIRLN